MSEDGPLGEPDNVGLPRGMWTSTEGGQVQQEEITRIKVGNHVVGIWGLKTVLENLADSLKGKRENEIRDILVRELGKKNYIP